MEELERLQAELAEMETAERKLAMGEKVVLLSFTAEGANTRQYHPANVAALRLLILGHRQRIARLTGVGKRRLYYI